MLTDLFGFCSKFSFCLKNFRDLLRNNFELSAIFFTMFNLSCQIPTKAKLQPQIKYFTALLVTRTCYGKR